MPPVLLHGFTSFRGNSNPQIDDLRLVKNMFLNPGLNCSKARSKFRTELPGQIGELSHKIRKLPDQARKLPGVPRPRSGSSYTKTRFPATKIPKGPGRPPKHRATENLSPHAYTKKLKLIRQTPNTCLPSPKKNQSSRSRSTPSHPPSSSESAISSRSAKASAKAISTSSSVSAPTPASGWS
jgi:hypothetical protein